MGSIRNKAAALLLGLGLLGGGVFAVEAAAAPAGGPPVSFAAQATPDAADPQCLEEQNEEAGEQEANGTAQATPGAGQEANGADDDAEGDTEDNGDDEQDENSEDDAAEGDTKDTGEDEQGENGAEQESASATPGALTQGQDLLPKARITVEQAVTTAQGAATGDLGTVELEDRQGTLVFEVTVGDQEVFVDATTGTVASVEPVQNTGNGCEDDAAVAPGTLTEGQELLPKAGITVEQAIRTAQGAATGDLSSVELDQDSGALVFTVNIGDQEVTVDAASGAVLSVEQDN